MAIFKGAGVAIVTPMYEDGKVNYDKLEELLEFQIANSTDAIIICGTTGESSTMTHGEHLKTIKFAIDKVNKRVPVIAGTGSNCTETAIMMSKEAASYGADALLVVTPYYNKATQKGLIAHYTAIANAVPETPIIMYNVPSRTGCNIQPATVATLVKNVKNIVGLKAASGDLSQIAKTVSLAGADLELYSGNDDQVLPILSLGGLGVISVLSNVAPKETHDMVMKFMEGDTAGAAKIQIDAIPLINALFCEVNPIMVKIIMHGCCGHMGQVISDLVAKDANAEIVAGIDVTDKGNTTYPVFTNIKECQTEADVLIDFSSAKAADALLDYCTERNLPVVLCTTGLSEEQLAKVEETAKKIPVLKSANMSLGINTLMKLIQEAAKVLATAGFDMEIVEKHHHLKLDAPSGTALALADSLNEAMDNQYHYVYDRSQKREMRDEKEIGISAVRGGTIVGEHEVIFAGEDEVIEFKHTAYSKAIFGKGAIEAAKFLAGKPAGKYDMADVIEG